VEYEAAIQSVLDIIDDRITETIRVDELARAANYSAYHFCRVFAAVTGTPAMSYVTRRKLEYARCDLSRGKRIIDAAMDYGFETHSGFTKAFRKCFGYPPSMCRLHVRAGPPERTIIGGAKKINGGTHMNPYIIVMTPFTAAGRTIRQQLPNVKRHADIPAFCFGVNSREAEITDLCPTQEDFKKSDAIKHCEISMCYDVDPDSGEFTYLLGRGVFHPDELKNIPPGMTSVLIDGLYAVFSTPPTVLFNEHDAYAQLIQDTWNEIFLNWLPGSEFEYDEARKDFEFYDYRDHGWYFGNRRQMDICIPIRQRGDARLKSQKNGEALWADEMKRREKLK